MEDQSVKKGSNKNIIWTILAVVLIIIVALNWQTIYRAFAPPNPVIVSKGADHSSTKLFDFSAKVWAEVRNDGGDGTIAMEATFSQGGNTFKKTTTMHFKSLETQRMEIIFDEAKLLGGESSYSVNVYPYGK